MTIKEMFKKVEAYNEVAELIGNRKVEIHFTECYQTIKATSFKEFSKEIKKIYADFAWKAILSGDYELYKDELIKAVDDYGYMMVLNLEFGIYEI